MGRDLSNFDVTVSLSCRWDYSVTEDDIKEVLEEANHDLQIPQNFSPTVCYNAEKSHQKLQPVHRINPQTTEFCARFGLVDINDRIQQLWEDMLTHKDKEEHKAEEQEEVDSTGSAEEPSDYNTNVSGLSCSANPDEIVLDDSSDDEGLDSHSADPSSDHPSSTSTAFSDVRILPDSMTVSPSETVDFANNDELEKRSDGNQTDEQSPGEKSLKRLSGNSEDGDTGTKRIKRRNQAIYASKEDDDDVE